MADIMVSYPNLQFPNSREAVSDQGGRSNNLANSLNYNSINAMRTRLQTVNAGYYTNARLDQLTVNDMIFAVRNVDDATTIADYMTNSTA